MNKVSYGIIAMAFLALAACGKKQSRPAASQNPFTGAWLAPTCVPDMNGSTKEAIYLNDKKEVSNVTEIYSDANCASLVDITPNYFSVYENIAADKVKFNIFSEDHILTLSADKIKDSITNITYTKVK